MWQRGGGAAERDLGSSYGYSPKQQFVTINHSPVGSQIKAAAKYIIALMQVQCGWPGEHLLANSSGGGENPSLIRTTSKLHALSNTAKGGEMALCCSRALVLVLVLVLVLDLRSHDLITDPIWALIINTQYKYLYVVRHHGAPIIASPDR